MAATLAADDWLEAADRAAVAGMLDDGRHAAGDRPGRERGHLGGMVPAAFGPVGFVGGRERGVVGSPVRAAAAEIVRGDAGGDKLADSADEDDVQPGGAGDG